MLLLDVHILLYRVFKKQNSVFFIPMMSILLSTGWCISEGGSRDSETLMLLALMIVNVL